jgi:hypothetical protein
MARTLLERQLPVDTSDVESASPKPVVQDEGRSD